MRCYEIRLSKSTMNYSDASQITDYILVVFVLAEQLFFHIEHGMCEVIIRQSAELVVDGTLEFGIVLTKIATLHFYQAFPFSYVTREQIKAADHAVLWST